MAQLKAPFVTTQATRDNDGIPSAGEKTPPDLPPCIQSYLAAPPPPANTS